MRRLPFVLLLGVAACSSGKAALPTSTLPTSSVAPTTSAPTPSATPSPTPSPTAAASASPTPRATTARPTPSLTRSPTPRPTVKPTVAPTAAPTVKPTPTTTAPAGKTYTILMQSPYTFSPASLSIAVGDKVVVKNVDSTDHTFTDKGVFDSGNVAASATYTYTFSKAGTFNYLCSYHEEFNMKGTITVR